LKKKYFITIATIFIGLILLVISFYKFFAIKDGFNVIISNNTNTQISGIKITYHNIKKDIEVPMIEPGQKTTLHINPKEDFVENQMKLNYGQSNGNKQSMVIIGYFEKGYSGNVTVKISSKDSSGFAVFDVDENIKVH
jgi:hypothetical protein